MDRLASAGGSPVFLVLGMVVVVRSFLADVGSASSRDAASRCVTIKVPDPLNYGTAEEHEHQQESDVSGQHIYRYSDTAARTDQRHRRASVK